MFGQSFSGWLYSEQSWKTENCLPLEQTTGLLTALEDKNSVPPPRDRYAHCPLQNSQIIKRPLHNTECASIIWSLMGIEDQETSAK